MDEVEVKKQTTNLGIADAVLATSIDTKLNGVWVSTIREYLTKILLEFWVKDERFDVSRPFGNSGWRKDIALALVDAGLVDGEIGEDGYLVRCNDKEVDHLICQAIRRMGNA